MQVEARLFKEIGDDWVQVGNKQDVQDEAQRQQAGIAAQKEAQSRDSDPLQSDADNDDDDDDDDIDEEGDDDEVPHGHDRSEL